MPFLDWILVFFGATLALAGGWIQLHPERLYPGTNESWPLDPAALKQIRLLGACFLFMGAFFALQMTIDLTRLPWWTGTLGGLATAISAVALVQMRVHRKRRRWPSLQQPSQSENALEVR